MRAVVTGGAGFIGSNLVDALVERGDEVLVLDDVSTGRRENLQRALAAGVELDEIDVRDAGAVAAAIEPRRPDWIFHLAAQIDVRRSAAETAFDAEVNVLGTINVLEAARDAGGARVVFASTGGAIYGTVSEGRLPAGEDVPTAPEAPYGQSKLAAEGYCSLYTRLHGLPTVSLRLGNVFGPRQDPLGEAGVVAIFCGRALAGERPVIFGDGEQTRDYVYVGDVVRAILAAAGSDATGELNIATGSPTSVNELVAVLGPHAAGDFEPVHEEERPGEVRHIHLDSTRARETLGWSAEVGVAEGVELTLATLR